MSKRILVTGGNSGIGFALCKQLVADHGCHVYLGARSIEKGAAAVASIKEASVGAVIELVEIDTGSDESVMAAAASVKASLGTERLYAVVNNAGTGLAHGVDAQTMINTNMYGPKRVCESFIPLLSASEGRIANVGSGAGPKFVSGAPVEMKRVLCNPDVSMDEIDNVIKEGLQHDSMKGYGVSKACLTAYTMLLAKQNPHLAISCLSPGFINTAIVAGFGASKSPEEGTVAMRHCLFEKLDGNGWYYGSDAVRSPLHFMRNPGEPAYDGKVDF